MRKVKWMHLKVLLLNGVAGVEAPQRRQVDAPRLPLNTWRAVAKPSSGSSMPSKSDYEPPSENAATTTTPTPTRLRREQHQTLLLHEQRSNHHHKGARLSATNSNSTGLSETLSVTSRDPTLARLVGAQDTRRV